MSRLLVFCAHDRRPHALVEELDAADELDFTWTTDLGVLDATLAQGSHALCLLLLRGEPSPELAAVLDRAREAGQLRGAVSIHSVPSPSGLRAMLKLGVREAFLEPVTPRRVVQALKLRLRELPGPVVATGAFQERDPIPCELCTYGRVVRLSAARPGSLLVRTNLVLERGAEVVIAGPLMRALGVERARFHAVSPDPAAQGDGYAAAWWLDQPVEAQILTGWERVVAGLSVVDGDGCAVPAADSRSRCSFVSQARLVAVSTHGFEVSPPPRGCTRTASSSWSGPKSAHVPGSACTGATSTGGGSKTPTRGDSAARSCPSATTPRSPSSGRASRSRSRSSRRGRRTPSRAPPPPPRWALRWSSSS